MVIATKFSSLRARVLILLVLIAGYVVVRAFFLLVQQWVIEVFYQSMAILAVSRFGTIFPRSVFHYQIAFLWVIEIEAWRSSKILLSMGVVAVRPLMLLVDHRTERSLIAVDHK
jgi:hypothetical protein